MLLWLIEALSDVSVVDVIEFEDADSASSSDMDEYESEDELGEMIGSPRNQQHKKAQPAKKSGADKSKKSDAGKSKPSYAGQSKTKPEKTASTSSSKPRPSKPAVTSKPVKSSSDTMSAGTTASVKPGSTAASEDVGSFLGMREYMEAMDRELARTTVGKSFVRHGDTVGFLSALF